MSQKPPRKRRSRSARRTRADRRGSSRRPRQAGADERDGDARRRRRRTKATCRPTIDATPPSTGPSSAPTIAAPSAVPSSSPRRLRGAAPMSHARPPAQESALPSPCTKRASPSPQALSANAKPTLAAPMTSSPASAAGFGADPRGRRSRPGSAPASTPIAYDATRSPAPVFERPNSSTKSGRSGVSAA